MKAIDDITSTEADVLCASLEFAYDSRPLVAGELGAGIFAPVDGEPELFDDTELITATDKPGWLLEADF